jgi:Uma2 family endonuclease
MWFMTATAAPPRFRPPRHFENAAEWLRALGDVPLERIIFDPWPGTATEADLLHFVAREKLCELIDGTLVEKPVGWAEAIIATYLSAELVAYCKRTGAGIVSGADSTMRMSSSGRVRLPDVAFVSTARVPRTPAAIPTLAPDLAVEVLSESNTPNELDKNLREYFDFGTRLAWVIDPPTRRVAVYHHAGEPTRVLSEADHLGGEQVLPGFSLPVSDLFRIAPNGS